MPEEDSIQGLEAVGGAEQSEDRLFDTVMDDLAPVDQLALSGLIRQAQRSGSISFYKIRPLLERSMSNPTFIEDLYALFAFRGINIKLRKDLKDPRTIKETIKRWLEKIVAAEINHVELSDGLSPDTLKQFLEVIEQVPNLSATEETDNFRKADKGDEEAIKRLFEANLHLVIAVARGKVGRGLSYIELVKEGMRGLTYAIESYDYNKGSAFSSFAESWIDKVMEASIHGERAIPENPYGHIVERE